MGQARPTIEKRQLGQELRRLRVAAGMQQKDVAAIIKCDPSLISKVESGERALKAAELTAILDQLRVPADKRDEILALGQEARKPKRRRMHTDPFPGAFRRIGDLEEEARELYSFQGEVIPGMLQTEEYARALIQVSMSALSEEGSAEVEARVQFRLDRQRLLRRTSPPPPKMWFVVGEAALQRPIGGAPVMREQLRYLLDVTKRWPYIKIQIVSTATIDHPLLGGTMTVFRFGGQVPDIVHQSTFVGGGVYLDAERDTAECFRAFAALRSVALGPEDSRVVISRYADMHASQC